MKTKQYKKKAVILTTLLACLTVYLFIDKKIVDRPISVDNRHEVAFKKLLAEPIKESKELEVGTIYSTPRYADNVNIAPSLEGTEIDGKLVADENGNLILDLSVRDFFDYFLVASDDVGPEFAINEIVRYANEYLPEPANTQAIELLKNYLRYKKTEIDLQQAPIYKEQLTHEKTIELLSENFNALKERRSELFDEKTEQALFSLEDSYAEYTLESLKIRSSKNLSNEEKSLRLLELKEILPSELASSERRHDEAQEKQKEVDSLVNSAIDDSQLHNRLIESGYSYQKADEIISHRQEKAYFDKQYIAYKQAQKSLDGTRADTKELLKKFFVKAEEQTKAELMDLDKN